MNKKKWFCPNMHLADHRYLDFYLRICNFLSSSILVIWALNLRVHIFFKGKTFWLNYTLPGRCIIWVKCQQVLWSEMHGSLRETSSSNLHTLHHGVMSVCLFASRFFREDAAELAAVVWMYVRMYSEGHPSKANWERMNGPHLDRKTGLHAPIKARHWHTVHCTVFERCEFNYFFLLL